VKSLFLLAVAGGLLVAPVADARDWRGFGPLVQAQGQPMKKGPPPGQQFQRGERDRGHGEQDRRNQGRLTQEERRDLHRDLDRANREIYRRH